MTAHILVVDDDPLCLDALEAYLQLSGFRVSTAQHGGQALEIDLSDPADLVVTDISMPFLDGYELCKALNLRHPDLPVVLMSAIPTEERRPAKAKHLVKPVTGPVLIETVQHLLAVAGVDEIGAVADDLQFTVPEGEVTAALQADVEALGSAATLDLIGVSFGQGARSPRTLTFRLSFSDPEEARQISKRYAAYATIPNAYGSRARKVRGTILGLIVGANAFLSEAQSIIA